MQAISVNRRLLLLIAAFALLAVAVAVAVSGGHSSVVPHAASMVEYAL